MTSLVNFINSSDIKTVTKMNNRDIVNRYLQEAAQEFSLPDFSAISHRPDFATVHQRFTYELTADFIETVASKLPAQPWPTGIHKEIAHALGCANGKVSQAIYTLVENGSFYKQVNGIIYDSSGNIIPTEELLKNQ